MSLRVILRPEAQADLLETRDWYDQQELGLGMAFADSVDEAVARIEAMPQMYAIVFHNVRRGKLRRFPYLIYYRVLSDRSEVLAVLHASRDPKRWQARVN
jgi:plasmid stabilization system protein ParE